MCLNVIELMFGSSGISSQNLCVRDWEHAPVLRELPLKSWWKPEYSLQRTDAQAQVRGLGRCRGHEAAAPCYATPCLWCVSL